MTLQLSKLKSSNTKKRKRIARGDSGKGGTYGARGLKGQRSRSGGKRKAVHHGKKSPSFISQIPKKRGFKTFRPQFHIVNLSQLNTTFDDGENITPSKLVKEKLVPSIYPGIKILSNGTIKKKITVSAHRFSKSAEDAIKKAGGSVLKIERQAPPKKKKEEKKGK
ncbi:50S ribosomal protein L15 [Patescibacteria group bacterium]|nr:50S ribosomal protein L15 [Patescibacteria group bacterium]MBU1075334.1 50S ribosomal protein L15 [Patescibacteria group bacterium]MBU1951414.1 50S ribosomal protein L15 [Patescibacteria group bacterium]MBU2229289.1 50S ribosomal protein L15 [Patescibacteria group bacterium]